MTTQLHPDFPYCVDRTLEGNGEIEVAIEVKHFEPASEHNGWIDHRDPAYSPGYVEFGRAYYLDGRECVLTELEREAAETAFWNL